MDDLLAASVAALDTIPTFAPGLGGAPERSYVSPGEPAADCCPQLTVHSTGINEENTDPFGSGKRIILGRLNQVALMVTIFRCVPVSNNTLKGVEPPAVVDEEAASEQMSADAWALWNHIPNMIRAGLLFEKCKPVFMDGMRALPQQGGCGGWIMLIRVTLDGYEEVLP